MTPANTLLSTATPIFRDRGLASLRRGKDGSLVLDKGLVPQRPRAIRVRVKDHGQFTGSSTLQKPSSNADDSIEGRILQARDTVYEEELFHELIREARTMAGHGVTMHQDLIQLSSADEQEILVDLVDAEPGLIPDEADVTSNQDDDLANTISHAIHILLAFSHRQNLHRRMQIPPPLSQKRRHTPEYQLLRPIVAYLQHLSHVRWLESFLQDTYGVLKAAKLNCQYTSTHFSSMNLARKNRPVSKVEALVGEFLGPLESTFAGDLVTPQNSFKVNIRTNLLPPFHGTHYEINIKLPQYPQVQPPTRIGLRDEAGAVINHVIMLDLVTAISSYRPQQVKPIVQDGTKQETENLITWEPAYLHHGELLASSPSFQQKKMTVALSRTELTLQTYMRGVEGPGSSIEDMGVRLHSHTWKRDPSVPEKLSMMEFVAEASKEN